MTELILIVGVIGAGKTTHAKELAASTGAVRFTPDDWMVPLFNHSDPKGMRDVMEGRLIWTATEVLRSGGSVILDFGFWGREERASLAWLASTVGAVTRTVYLPIDRQTQTDWVAKRWLNTPEQTWEFTQAELDESRGILQEPDADELAGVYTTQPTTPGGWAEWIHQRWPTALRSRQA
jgi:predicted kinase